MLVQARVLPRWAGAWGGEREGERPDDICH
jgi:hypothetical protein